MMVALAGCLAAFLVWRIFTRHTPWPQRFLNIVSRIAGAQVRVVGRPLSRRMIILANHVSWLDIPVLGGITGTAFVAHSGLQASRLLTWLCGLNDTVFITRHQRRSVHGQVDQVRTALADMGALTIFPEGTTSDGTALLPFKSSLLSALEPAPEDIVVQPVWLDYGPDSAAMAWFGNESGLTNALRLLARSEPTPVTVHFLEPFAPAEAGCRKAMASLTQECILAAMKLAL